MRILYRSLINLVACSLLVSSLQAASVPPITTDRDPRQIEAPAVDPKQIATSNAIKKPAWLTELSVTTKESYDSNVFGTDTDKPGSYPRVANVSSWVTSVTPKLVFNFAALLDYSNAEEKTIDTLSLSYAPEVTRYHEAATENYEAHRIHTQIKGKVDSFSYNFENSLLFLVGNRNTPLYNQVSCYGSALVRERRDQIQDRAKLSLRNDWESVFFRGVGTTTYYDLNTYQYNNNLPVYAGYQDYVDRYEVNGGGDVGYKITKDFALTFGYRHGHQYQQTYSWVDVNSTNDFDRVLVGIEGKPFKWLKVEFQGGPDFHYYEAQKQVGHADELTRAYLNGSVTADVTSKDVLAFRVKQWQWVSSTGLCTYEDKTFDFSYRHKIVDQLSASLGYMILGATYDAPTVRSDWQYTYSIGLKYDLNENLSFTGDYSFIQGVNESDISNLPPGREFDRHVVCLGVRAAF
ncbi:MAG: hypothetical protein B9S32_09095 [Verrucomicrobia bacterium Tous-C9LFEB]|nr:MAG: hypothetical protein B9S32_09095 [Verrucomicrobia bacterium Tous-C9LFEB]